MADMSIKLELEKSNPSFAKNFVSMNNALMGFAASFAFNPDEIKAAGDRIQEYIDNETPEERIERLIALIYDYKREIKELKREVERLKEVSPGRADCPYCQSHSIKPFPFKFTGKTPEEFIADPVCVRCINCNRKFWMVIRINTSDFEAIPFDYFEQGKENCSGCGPLWKELNVNTVTDKKEIKKILNKKIFWMKDLQKQQSKLRRWVDTNIEKETSFHLGKDYCNQCGACCRYHPCSLTIEDLKSLASHFNITPRKFFKRYVVLDRQNDEYVMYLRRKSQKKISGKVTPLDRISDCSSCVFFNNNNLCEIHKVKPKAGKIINAGLIPLKYRDFRLQKSS